MDVVRASRLAAAAYVAGVRDARVLEAMAAVPRGAYVRGTETGATERDRPIATAAAR